MTMPFTGFGSDSNRQGNYGGNPPPKRKGSSFKKYRQTVTDPAAVNPGQIIASAMPSPGGGGGAMEPPPPLETGSHHFEPRPQSFDANTSMPQGTDITPMLDDAMDRGYRGDKAKAANRQAKIDQLSSGLQGFAQGLGAAAGGGESLNFGEAFARGFGTAAGATRGSMHTIEDRRAVEEARQREIEDTFFTRSTKLQELAIARRKVEADESNDRIGRELQSRGIAATERRNQISDDRLTSLEGHWANQDNAAATNAGASVIRAKASVAKVAAKPKPKSAGDIDKYARQRVYLQYGATDESGKVLDPQKKSRVDQMLSQSGRRTNNVQAAYEKARSEATRSTVDASDDEDDSQ